MKTILLMRHAKSSWKHPEMKDFDRPLNKRGEKDAPHMGKLLQEENLLPDLILASPAVRAKTTVEALVNNSSYAGDVRYLMSLYMAEPSVMIDLLKVLSDNFNRVMIVGHNPGLEAMLQVLTHKVEALSTATVAEITLPIEHWGDLTRSITGKLAQIRQPKDVKTAEK